MRRESITILQPLPAEPLKRKNSQRLTRHPREGALESGNGSASRISEKRILQISNDISEAMCSANRRDIMAVASYWADRTSELAMELEALRSTAQVGLATLCLKLNRKTPKNA